MLFIKKCEWGQAGQGQWNVTVWKLVSWDFRSSQYVFFYTCGVFFCGMFEIVVVWVKWGTVARVVVVEVKCGIVVRFVEV